MADKRRRRPRAELRDLMLEAGKEVLFEIEPSLGFEHLTYTAVFARLQSHRNEKVTIGSVHGRIWSSQRDFQLAVLAEALEDTVSIATNSAHDNAQDAISRLPRTTPAERKYALRAAIRLNSIHILQNRGEEALALAHQVRFRLWALGPDHPEAAGFTETITDLRRTSTESHAQVVRAVMAAIGLRVRADAGDPEQAIRSIALLGNATTLGLRTDVLEEASATRDLPTGPNGELEPWHPDMIALWAFVALTFELDGDDLTADERRL